MNQLPLNYVKEFIRRQATISGVTLGLKQRTNEIFLQILQLGIYKYVLNPNTLIRFWRLLSSVVRV